MTQNLARVLPQLIFVPAIVFFELQVGIVKSSSSEKRIQQVQQLLNQTTVVPFDLEGAVASAKIRAHLEQQGMPIGSLDVLIAGTAIALQATLVTHNVREFLGLRD